MKRRQPLPRLWMMTDERQGEALWAALDRLPRGAGIVFRHYSLEKEARRALFERVSKLARRRKLTLVVARPTRLKADGAHNHAFPPHIHAASWKLRTMSAHNMREVRQAERNGADLVFLSPVYPTRSHPGAASLGPVRFGLIARNANIPVIALGGMTIRRARHLERLGAYGWAGIDAWSGD